jgi:hypothetical protein
MRKFAVASLAVAVSVVLASCGDTAPTRSADESTRSPLGSDPHSPFLSQRIDSLDEAVSNWLEAQSLRDAHAAAETALNLVVGPNGPGYGDPDDDSVENGATAEGLLPGLDGTPVGLAMALSENECVVRDVLGGSWVDPRARWAEMLDAIYDWRPNSNTMPTLASHPMRVVGWATFALDSDSLDDAHEYAGHANLHVNISRRALDC